MPFALNNVPVVFQALVNDVLKDFIGDFVLVYLNDILIYFHDSVEHTKQVRHLENQ